MLGHSARDKMKANEIFAEMKDDTATSVFQFLREEERQVYSAALSGLAANRKLRPVFVQKKPVPQQIEWLVKNVRLKGSSEVAENVLQLWLLKGNSEMLIGFLDGLGIEHDGKGAAEDIPDSIEKKKLEKTVKDLMSKYDSELVKIYLHTFQRQRADGWKEISELIDATPELQFATPAAAAEKESEEAGGAEESGEE